MFDNSRRFVDLLGEDLLREDLLREDRLSECRRDPPRLRGGPEARAPIAVDRRGLSCRSDSEQEASD